MEDKIFGPLTFKQFIYIVGAGGVATVLFTLLPKLIAGLISLPIVALGLALAFFKVNERPFALMIEDFVKFHIGAKLYIWKKTAPKPTAPVSGQTPLEQLYVPKLSGNKLKDLTFELDVKNQSNPVTQDDAKA